MINSDLVALACSISRGGFSDERVFSIDDVGYKGVASRSHMWTVDGAPLGEGEPPTGNTIPGLVAARVIELADENRVLVSIPDGEVVLVSRDALKNRPPALAYSFSGR